MGVHGGRVIVVPGLRWTWVAVGRTMVRMPRSLAEKLAQWMLRTSRLECVCKAEWEEGCSETDFRIFSETLPADAGAGE